MENATFSEYDICAAHKVLITSCWLSMNVHVSVMEGSPCTKTETSRFGRHMAELSMLRVYRISLSFR